MHSNYFSKDINHLFTGLLTIIFILHLFNLIIDWQISVDRTFKNILLFSAVLAHSKISLKQFPRF